MAKFKPLIAIPLSVWLAACASSETRIEGNGAAIEAGMKLRLNERLQVPAHDTYSYIQDGKAMRARLVDQYYAYCRFEMHELADTQRHIEPDTFTLVRIVRQTELVQLPMRQFATLEMSGAASATAEAYYTIFGLDSVQQPGVERLFCSHWEDPTLFPKHLTAKQIRNTLTPIAEFVPPDAQ